MMDVDFESLMLMDGDQLSYSSLSDVDTPLTYHHNHHHFSCLNSSSSSSSSSSGTTDLMIINNLLQQQQQQQQPPFNFNSSIVDLGTGIPLIRNKSSDWNINRSCLKWVCHDLKKGGSSSSSTRRKQPEKNYRRRSSMARTRRQKISEKIRLLQKTLPWEDKIKKMNIATMLEEAYKYVQFLQAQLLVLQAMPILPPPQYCISSSLSSTSTLMYGAGAGAGGFGNSNLNRPQVLELLLNSKLAQTVLYSQGLCVYSVEQLILLMSQVKVKTTNPDHDDDHPLYQQPQHMLADDDHHHPLYQQPQQILFNPPSPSPSYYG